MSSGTHAQQNPNNPYDRIGQMHNYLLNAFFTEETKAAVVGQWTQQTLNDYMCKKFPELDCKFINQVMNDKLMSAVKGKTLMESETILLGLGLVHPRHGYYIQQINDLIENHFGEDYSVCYRAFLLLEDQIIIDPDLSPSEIINLLCSSSIGRYSVKFWQDVTGGIVRYPSIGSDITNFPTSGGSNVGKDDVKGAVTGVVAGAAGGGGAGSLPAAVAGGLVGGAAASVVSAVSSIWHWLF